YRAVDIDSLASRQHIQDLLSLTSALLHPADRIAWLAVLRAPWCGLTLTDLHCIAGQNTHATLYELLNNKATYQLLSLDGQHRLDRIFPILKAKIAERERTNLRSWVESTWLMLGGPACLKHPNDIEDANEFFASLNELNQHNPFVNLEKLTEKINELYASSQQEASVHIMTIHTAKGLEFDTVILPHLERKNAMDDKTLLQWMEQTLPHDKNAILLAPIQATGDVKNSLYEYIHRQQKMKSDYETDRLFYVATTRASKRLYLFFDIEQNEQENIRIESSSFLKKLWPFIEKKIAEMLVATTSENEMSQENNSVKYLQRLTQTWQNPLKDHYSTIIPAYHKQQNGFQLRNTAAKIIGIVVHRLLQQLAKIGTKEWQDKSDDNQYAFLANQLKQNGLKKDDIETTARLIINMIKNILLDPRGQWILHPHQATEAELALTTILNHKAESLVIDRTFVDENNIRWIIDYKTTAFSQEDSAIFAISIWCILTMARTRPSCCALLVKMHQMLIAKIAEEDLEQFLSTEKEKYLQQMTHYYQAIKLIETRPIRLGLYFPAIPAWIEWGPTD
ncbi:MAG: hypothetical protein JO149_03345, partial [Gammaproteobacteria bacterium]|nr:hypothetical protein [Gammaproteobacteria bacterium]